MSQISSRAIIAPLPQPHNLSASPKANVNVLTPTISRLTRPTSHVYAKMYPNVLIPPVLPSLQFCYLLLLAAFLTLANALLAILPT